MFPCASIDPPSSASAAVTCDGAGRPTSQTFAEQRSGRFLKRAGASAQFGLEP